MVEEEREEEEEEVVVLRLLLGVRMVSGSLLPLPIPPQRQQGAVVQ